MDLFYLATSLQPDGSVSFTLTVIIAGLGIVLSTLALLILIFSLFGKVLSASQNKKIKKEEADKKQTEDKKKNEIPLPPPIIEDGIAPEIIAAISAAVYMQNNSDVTIKSIKRKRSRTFEPNVWAQAAVVENTKPF